MQQDVAKGKAHVAEGKAYVAQDEAEVPVTTVSEDRTEVTARTRMSASQVVLVVIGGEAMTRRKALASGAGAAATRLSV